MMGKMLSGELSCTQTGLVNPIALRKAKIMFNFGLLSAKGLTIFYNFITTNKTKSKMKQLIR